MALFGCVGETHHGVLRGCIDDHSEYLTGPKEKKRKKKKERYILVNKQYILNVLHLKEWSSGRQTMRRHFF